MESTSPHLELTDEQFAEAQANARHLLQDYQNRYEGGEPNVIQDNIKHVSALHILINAATPKEAQTIMGSKDTTVFSGWVLTTLTGLK